MAQSQTQFTPAQIFDVARRAEAEGRHEHALQFYRHLVDHCAGTPEAHASQHAIIRLNPQPAAAQQPSGLNGVHDHAHTAANGAAPDAHALAPASARTPPYAPAQPADAGRRSLPHMQPSAVGAEATEHQAKPGEHKPRSYLIGRVFASLVIALGAIAMASGCGLLAAVFIAPGFVGVVDGSTPLINAALSAISVITIGIVLVLAGLTARAVFDNARATQNLAAAEHRRHDTRR